MTIIGNNNGNNPSSLTNLSTGGSKDPGESIAGTSFMDIISMLSLSSEIDRREVKYSDLVINNLDNKTSISDLSMFKQFLTDNNIASKIFVGDEKNEISSNDTAAKFLTMLREKNSLGFEHFKDAELNVNSLPVDKVLLDIALKNVKSPFNGIESIAGSRRLVESVEEKAVQPQNNFNPDTVPQISQLMINSSILDETSPKTVLIDLENIVKEAPKSFTDLRITKIFTAFGEEESFAAPEIQLSKLDIIINPGSAELKLENQDTLPLNEKIFFSDHFFENNDVLAVELEKPTVGTFITSIQVKDFGSEENFPQKIYLTFKQPTLLRPENNFKIAVRPESEFLSSDLIVDRDHAALLTKLEANPQKPATELLADVQIFKAKVTKDIDVGNNIFFINKDEITRSFSDRLSTSLESIVSGEFSSRQIVQKLDSYLQRKDAEKNLEKNLKSPFIDLLKSINRKVKPALMMSTADILSHKQIIPKNDTPFYDFQWIDAIGERYSKENFRILNEMPAKENLDMDSNKLEAKFTSSNLVDNIRQLPGNQVPQVKGPQNIIFPLVNSAQNSLNLYDSHFSSRLSMLLTDQILNGKENFELQLEPESFGKVRINVSLENSNVDVKMVADNSAAVLALRGSENILQNIAEQNGLRLSDYSVDMQQNQNGDNSGRKNADKEGELVNSQNNDEFDENAPTQTLDNTYNLNLLA